MRPVVVSADNGSIQLLSMQAHLGARELCIRFCSKTDHLQELFANEGSILMPNDDADYSHPQYLSFKLRLRAMHVCVALLQDG